MRLVAQVNLTDRCGNITPLTIRVRDNEITYDTGYSALSNHFNLHELPRLYQEQSNKLIVTEALAALKYSPETEIFRLAKDPII
jgi:hypothetical protein